MLESDFQSALIEELEDLFPGCIVLKNDPTYIQGFPDLLILYRDRWAALECKESENATERPNQGYYVAYLSELSYASFIYPENKRGVLRDLQQAFKSGRHSRFSQRQ